MVELNQWVEIVGEGEYDVEVRDGQQMLDLLLQNPTSKLWDLLKLNIGLRLRTGLFDMLPHGDERIAARIVDGLETCTLDEQQRALVVRMLGRTATSERVELLIDVLLHGSPTIQGAAAEALGYVGDARGVNPLRLFLSVSNNELREIAAEALGFARKTNDRTAEADAKCLEGHVLEAQGELTLAQAAYHQFLTIYRRLAKQDPSNAGWQRELAVAYSRAGGVLQAQGRLEAAQAAFEQNLAISRRLAEQDPSNAGWQRELAAAHNRAGGV